MKTKKAKHARKMAPKRQREKKIETTIVVDEPKAQPSVVTYQEESMLTERSHHKQPWIVLWWRGLVRWFNHVG